jgi:hypothetical protein
MVKVYDGADFTGKQGCLPICAYGNVVSLLFLLLLLFVVVDDIVVVAAVVVVVFMVICILLDLYVF